MKGYLCVKVLWGVVSMMLYAELNFFLIFFSFIVQYLEIMTIFANNALSEFNFVVWNKY